jgi:hypothetical protein
MGMRLVLMCIRVGFVAMDERQNITLDKVREIVEMSY